MERHFQIGFYDQKIGQHYGQVRRQKYAKKTLGMCKKDMRMSKALAIEDGQKLAIKLLAKGT